MLVLALDEGELYGISKYLPLWGPTLSQVAVIRLGAGVAHIGKEITENCISENSKLKLQRIICSCGTLLYTVKSEILHN